ncbi:ABC transporter ATP-binding protein [Pseudaminobacter sp. 19-2017]|uniref:ABC transporter ATP-binding protein n=1 Tax=Pseudaminobacter soli (ex Zhang et al. 2022) TaxID=2831468 RepID=A0A942E6D2_9HYPH|nr:ABC transporter ATP-binding protein [Pseudaminobacter soli]MBS3652090.1 ABC transporter ATP-binding protein [Pseudaminobacter soli]
MAASDILLGMSGLRIDGFSRGKRTEIVKGIDLELARGEILGVIGETGAGKSSLGLAAMGYVRAGCRFTGGSIDFDGLDLIGMTEEEKRRLRGHRIAYVAQSALSAFNPAHRLLDQTIETCVDRGLQTPEEARANAVELYRKLNLPDPENYGRRFPHQVSGGQLQRAMTAMAMMSRPDLIIFDEPTTALDVTTQVEVLRTIRDLVRQHGTAALYITHDLAVVSQLADRIAVLQHGRVVEIAPTRQMIANPTHDYTRSLWAVRNLDKPERRDGEPILRFNGVEASYGSSRALSEISFDVPASSFVGVVGESGSGKTTVARIVAGLLPISAGSVSFAGKPLAGLSVHRDRETLRRIQLVQQSADTSINPRHTIGQSIGRPLELYFGLKGRERDSRVVQLLEQMELGPEFLTRLPSELSGGQKQRVNIARALAAQPDLIVCDEVTSGLDQLVQEAILKLLIRVQEEQGVSYLFITHDMNVVQGISDKLLVMHQGRIVEQGFRSEVFSPPHHPYTERLLASVPQVDPDWLNRLVAADATP